MILYTENPKDSTKNTTRTDKMNSVRSLDAKLIYRNLLHFCTLNEVAEREIKTTISLTVATKIIKYLGINLTKEVKDPYSENYRMMKEIEADTNKWKDTPCSWNGRISIVLKYPYYPKQYIDLI